jgi:hypothetical protein
MHPVLGHLGLCGEDLLLSTITAIVLNRPVLHFEKLKKNDNKNKKSVYTTAYSLPSTTLALSLEFPAVFGLGV